ncbi:hypothetical protein RF55_23574, partial [Lasius niger]
MPKIVSDLLSLGDSFGLPIDLADKNDRLDSVLEVVKNFELCTNKIPQCSIEKTRTTVANSVHKWLSKQKHVTAIDKYLLKGFSICKKFLKTNDDILVTKADKGQVTVVMNRAEYMEKMNVLLNDQSTYKKLNKDPRPKSHVRDSWTFVNNIRHKNICDANIMISLDVTALFTNIPIDLVMKAVEKRWIQITLNTELTLQQFLYALEVVLGLNSFSFNGEYYEQVFGCP